MIEWEVIDLKDLMVSKEYTEALKEINTNAKNILKDIESANEQDKLIVLTMHLIELPAT